MPVHNLSRSGTLFDLALRALLLLSLGWVPTPLDAGTKENLSIIGFSADGRYLAYQLWGTQDGSGFPFCHVRLVDVVRNRFVEQRISVILTHEKKNQRESAEDQAQRKAEPYLRKYKIIRSNTGAQKYLAEAPPSPPQVNTTSQVVFSAANQTGRSAEYRISLTVISRSGSCSGSAGTITGFELRLSGNGSEVVLERVDTLPPSLNCGLGLGLHSVHTCQDKVVVFLQTARFGVGPFPDTSILVATGVLN